MSVRQHKKANNDTLGTSRQGRQDGRASHINTIYDLQIVFPRVDAIHARRKGAADFERSVAEGEWVMD